MRRIACLIALGWFALAGCAASEENVKKSTGYLQDGVALLQTDRQRAYISFQKAVQLNPQNRDAHYYLGLVHAGQTRYREAEDEFRRALSIDPEYAEAENFLGQVLQEQNRWTEAIAAYRRALSSPMYPTPDLALYNLGVALAHEGDQEGAKRAFEDALRIDPPTVPPAALHLELGRLYHRLGDRTRAKEALARVASLNKGGRYAAEAEKLLERLTP